MDTRKTPRVGRLRCPRSLLLAIAVVMLLGVGAASAGAASSIEGIWSFGGGQIAIQPLSDGTFVGTVVAETKFAECTHPVGQQVWTGMTLQPDGSYFGSHLWYESKPGSPCIENTERGRTAWRVIEANGSRFLRVCFSTPESGAPQPTIAPDGAPNGPSEYAEHHVTYGCVNSSPTAPLPIIEPNNPGGSSPGGSFSKAVILPATTLCVKLNSLKIKLQDPKFDPLKEVVIRIKGKKVASVHSIKQLKKGIQLKGLPNGTYTLKIVATTVLDQKLSGSRTYHSCVKTLPPSTKIKLHGSKSH
jgi:hypothetical protein